jgi:crotonobetainyl-CoA:carnitine CoA-transferase CaiB-like acyl-CoA transferase
VEAGLFVAGTAFLDASANGRSWHRYGNASPYKPAAPHGVYRCAGVDAWLAIACFRQDEWQALCTVAERPSWPADPRFATLDDRLAHRAALDSAVGDWTAALDAVDLMAELQKAGVPAGLCQTAADRCDRDPQLAHLEWLTEVPGTRIGTWPIAELPVKMSGARATVGGALGRGAPGYGEDNDYVYGELLGLSAGEIADLAASGVI